MQERFSTILLKDKQAKIIIALADKSQSWHIADIAKSTNVTYVHASKFIAKCQELGIIGCEVHGKIKTLTLTEKGSGIANDLLSISSKLGAGIESKVSKKEEQAAKPEK